MGVLPKGLSAGALAGLTSKIGSVGGFGGNSGALLSGILGNMKGGLSAGKFDLGSLGGMLSAIGGGAGKQKYQNYLYRYTIRTYQILIEGQDPVNLLPGAIEKVNITRDYDKNIHPILEILTTLPPKAHTLLKNNKDSAKIRLHIQKVQYTKSGDKVRAKDFINDSFSVIMDDESDQKDEENYENANKAQGGDGKNDKYVFNPQDYTTEYFIALWNQDHIDAMRKPVNGIFKDCTVANAITNIYSKIDGIKKILISPMDNNKKYSEIRLKPMNLMNVPAYMDKVYGTYYTGSCVFLDFRCLYFLSKNGVCDAKEKGEYTRTIIKVPKSDRADKHSVGTMIDTKNKFYYIKVEGDQVDFTAPSNTGDALEGNNITIVDPNKNESVAVEGAGTQNGNGNARIVEDSYSNEYNKSTLMSDVVESSKQATLRCYDYDDDAFTPNKEFVFTFDNEKMQANNGFYRLKNSQVILSKKSDDWEITGTHVLAFKASSGGDTSSKEKASTDTASSKKDASATNMQTMSNASVNSDTNKSVTANAAGGSRDGALGSNGTDSSGFKPSTPQPKVKSLSSPTVDVTGGASSSIKNIPKNNNYNYDSLGNLKGVNVPSYNVIKQSDSLSVQKAKILAQQKMLPSKTPQPKLQKV